MDPRVLFLVLMFAGFGMFVNVVTTNSTAVSKNNSSNIAKLLLDCKRSNSVSITECWRRLKRQPHIRDIDRNCVDSCMAECAKEKRGDCTESCKHCIRRMERQRHKVYNITETIYEPECSSGNCTEVAEKKDNPVSVNVTTHVYVHNHYDTNSTSTDGSPKKIPDNRPIITGQGCPCYFMIWLPCYCRLQYSTCQYPYQSPWLPCYYRPQYSPCQYPYQWPWIPNGGCGQMIPEMWPYYIQDKYTFILKPNTPIDTTKPTNSTIPTISTSTATPTISTSTATPTISTSPTGPTISTSSTTPTISNSSTSPTTSNVRTLRAMRFLIRGSELPTL